MLIGQQRPELRHRTHLTNAVGDVLTANRHSKRPSFELWLCILVSRKKKTEKNYFEMLPPAKRLLEKKIPILKLLNPNCPLWLTCSAVSPCVVLLAAVNRSRGNVGDSVLAHSALFQLRSSFSLRVRLPWQEMRSCCQLTHNRRPRGRSLTASPYSLLAEPCWPE